MWSFWVTPLLSHWNILCSMYLWNRQINWLPRKNNVSTPSGKHWEDPQVTEKSEEHSEWTGPGGLPEATQGRLPMQNICKLNSSSQKWHATCFYYFWIEIMNYSYTLIFYYTIHPLCICDPHMPILVITKEAERLLKGCLFHSSMIQTSSLLTLWFPLCLEGAHTTD